MSKKKTSMNELPPGVPDPLDVAEIEITESETVTLTDPEQLSAEVQVPLLYLNGYAKRRVDVYQTAQSAIGWKAAFQGLEQQEARLQNGKIVANIQDAIRYVGEQFAAQLG